MWALLDEAVLRRAVGGPEVMAEQIMHIVQLGRGQDAYASTCCRSASGVHPLMQSMLTLMWFEDQPPVAYSEGSSMGKVHDSPAVVERLRAATISH